MMDVEKHFTEIQIVSNEIDAQFEAVIDATAVSCLGCAQNIEKISIC